MQVVGIRDVSPAGIYHLSIPLFSHSVRTYIYIMVEHCLTQVL